MHIIKKLIAVSKTFLILSIPEKKEIKRKRTNDPCRESLPHPHLTICFFVL